MKKNQPDVAIDLSSAEAIRAAFAQRRPPTPAVDADGFSEDPTPEVEAQIESFARFVRAAIPRVLGTEPADVPRAFASWSAEQRVFLEEIARVPEELHLDAGTLSDSLRALGAFDIGPRDDDRLLRRYVGLSTHTVLEREIDARPLWLWLRLRLMGRIDEQALAAVFATLDDTARVELARRATDNAYQLMRRWPLPRDLTPEIETHDATQLYEILLALLEPLSASEREAAVSSERAAEIPNLALVLLLSTDQASRGETLTADDESLASALSLFTNTVIGRRLASALSQERRRVVIEGIELVPHNLDGWVYLDLLAAKDAQTLVLDALTRFKRPAKQSVARCLAQLVRTFDHEGRAALRDLAAKGGPNAKVIEAALDEPC